MRGIKQNEDGFREDNTFYMLTVISVHYTAVDINVSLSLSPSPSPLVYSHFNWGSA